MMPFVVLHLSKTWDFLVIDVYLKKQKQKQTKKKTVHSFLALRVLAGLSVFRLPRDKIHSFGYGIPIPQPFLEPLICLDIHILVE